MVKIDDFKKRLDAGGFRVTQRYRRGGGISAACGQLFAELLAEMLGQVVLVVAKEALGRREADHLIEQLTPVHHLGEELTGRQLDPRQARGGRRLSRGCIADAGPASRGKTHRSEEIALPLVEQGIFGKRAGFFK